MNKRYCKHDQYDFLLAGKWKQREKYFSKYFTVSLITLNRFQHPFQEGLLEKGLLKMILYHKIPATSSVFLNLKPKWRECFYLELCKFYPCNFAREEKEGAYARCTEGGSASSSIYSPFCIVFFQKKGLLFHVASSLKPLSHVYSRPITSPFMDKIAMNV